MEAIKLMQCIIMENTLIKLTLHDETKKRAHDSLSVSELKKTSSWASVGPATDKHQAPTHRLKLYVRAVIESEAWPTVVQLKRKP